jgi:hypothetical protein
MESGLTGHSGHVRCCPDLSKGRTFRTGRTHPFRGVRNVRVRPGPGVGAFVCLLIFSFGCPATNNVRAAVLIFC